MTELDVERERRAFVAAAEIEFRNDEPFTKRDFAVGLRTWLAAKRAVLGSAEPIRLRHMAVAEDGKLRWMTGRKIDNCELYAMPDFGNAPPLFTAPPAPVSAEPVRSVYAVRVHAWGGSTKCHDYEMSDGSIQTFSESEVPWATQPAVSTFATAGADLQETKHRMEKMVGMLGPHTSSSMTAGDVLSIVNRTLASAPPSTDAKDSEIIAAATNLVKAKGRYHSEGAYKRLSEAIAAKEL